MRNDVSTSDMLAAARDDGVVVSQADLLHEDEIDDDFWQLVCARDYMFECGVSWEEIREMDLEEILERYHSALQEDALILGV